MNGAGVPFDGHVVRLRNHAFEGANATYLLDGDVTTLVDTGIATPETTDQLRDDLREHGVSFADVDRVLLTHWHMDHSGLASAIQRAGDATVYVHEADAPIVAGDETAREAMDAHTRDLVERWGMPDDKQEELLAFLAAGEGTADEAPDVTAFADGATFDVGPVELEAVHLPGHSAGLTGFAFPGRDGPELFSGDALLPYYTPNVGGADVRVERPLERYLGALARIVDRGFERAWPGHRGPIVDPQGRAADIVAHHRDRTERVVDVLRDAGPADPWTVGAHLFGELHSIHILHGPGESYAHLEHLADAGVVAESDGEYGLVEDDPDLDALFPDVAGALSPATQPGP